MSSASKPWPRDSGAGESGAGESGAGGSNQGDSGSNSEPIADSGQSLQDLFAEFADQLERIAWSIVRDWPLAADAVQESFALLAEKLDGIPEENRRGWLVRTVQFQALNLRRRNRKHESNLPDSIVKHGTGLYREGMSSTKAEHELQLERREELDRISDAILQLSSDQQRVVKMRLQDEKSFAEIAGELQLPLGTVLSRMRLALTKIRLILKHE